MKRAMRHRRPAIAAALGAVLCTGISQVTLADSPQPAATIRERVNLNRDWRFRLGDPAGAQRPEFADTEWDGVGLPHSFSIPYFLSKDFYIGFGWYRRHFEVQPSYAGKRLFLEFEGVFQDAQVFVNGKPAGEHQGGYTGFSLDITSSVKPGDNLLAVRVNNLWNPRLAPRGGEHVFSGGIYRDVYLVVTNPLHVTWYGTFVTTPKVSQQSATVSVETEIRNESASGKPCTVGTAVLDPSGTLVATMRSTLNVPAGQTVTFRQTSSPIANPKLWHPSHPNLYTVHTTVFDRDQAVDTFDSPLGFRWFEWTADRGFFLNGEHYYFRGTNVHQDHAGWGDAVTKAGVDRDVRLVKEAGFDFIRGSHYPHHPAFADACDRLGILFWSENAFWGTGGFKHESFWNAGAYPPAVEDRPAFDESVKSQLREEIRIFRNHPSIVVWSMSNEPFFTDKETLPRVREFLKELVTLSHQLDPTRPAAIGGCQRGDLDKLGDIAGYNGDGARLFLNPGLPSVVTEYGSVRAERPGKYDPGWGDLPTGKDQDKSLPFPWRYPWRSGESLWCAFDHGSILGSEGLMGIVDYFRLPKRAWYWYRSEYAKVAPPEWPQTGSPAGLRLSADKYSIAGTDATDDVQLTVTVLDVAGKPISNSPPVELAVVSGPGEFPTGPSISFDEKSDIPIRDGQAAIEFRSYYAGQTVIRATSPGLRSGEATISTSGSPVFVPGRTPAVRPRPYSRFVATQMPMPDESLGRDKPTLVSSETTGHTGSMANDGDSSTSWQAAPGDSAAWWRIDLETVCRISSVTMLLPTDADYRFKIEVSDDGSSWREAADSTLASKHQRSRVVRLLAGSSGRYIRLNFTGVPAGLSEFEIMGRLAKATTPSR